MAKKETVVCGITLEDIHRYLETEELPPITDEEGEGILIEIEGAYDFSGCGLHGHELIRHIIEGE